MILLIQPYSLRLTYHPPLGLAYLAASLKANHITTKLLDLQFKDDWLLLYESLQCHTIEWVGLHVSTQNFSSARYVIRLIKLVSPDIPVIIGGPFVTTLPKFCLEELKADIAVMGEGEEIIIALDEALRHGQPIDAIPGLCFIKMGQYFQNSRAPVIESVDSLPMPDYEQIPPKRYSKSPWQIFKKGQIVGPILTSRGCPFNCSFCSASVIMGQKWRPRSAESVGEEMEYQNRNFGVDEFHIVDDNLIGTKDHAYAFCEEILRRNLKIHWKTPNGIRSNLLDRDLVLLMKKSGCYMLGFGIESGDKDILKKINKNIDFDVIRERLNLIRDHDIITFGYFILGFPWDSPASINKTIQASLNLPLDLAHFGFFSPLPGSEIFNTLPEEKVHYSLHKQLFFSPYVPDGMGEKLLRQLLRKAYLSFFLRPKHLAVIIRMLFSKITGLSGSFKAVLYYFLTKNIETEICQPPLTAVNKFQILIYNYIIKSKILVFILEGMSKGINKDISIINRFVKISKGFVLDVGFGEAPFCEIIPSDRYVGIDPKPSAVMTARSKFPNHIFLSGVFPKDCVSGNKFSLIIISKVLHHLSNREASSVLARAFELLAENGFIIILDPLPSERVKSRIHKLWFSIVERNRFLRSARQVGNMLPEQFELIETRIYKIWPVAFFYGIIAKRTDDLR